MNSPREINMLLDYVKTVVDQDDPVLPAGELADHAFVKMQGEMIPLQKMIDAAKAGN